MQTVERTYTVTSHNSFCAAGKILGTLLKELLGEEYVQISDFSEQDIMIDGSDTKVEDRIRIKLDGAFLAKRGGRVVHANSLGKRNAWIPSNGTGRTICNVQLEEIGSGNCEKPYTFKITMEFESKEDFLDRCKLAMKHQLAGDKVDWRTVQPGDKLQAYCLPDGPTLVVSVTAVGRDVFVAIPNFGNESDHVEHLYKKDDDWTYRESK